VSHICSTRIPYKTAGKSGLKNLLIPFSRGSAPNGARQLESGERKSSNFCN